MNDRSKPPSFNAGPNESQVRQAKKVFAEGGGKSSLPAAEILYGPPPQPKKKTPIILPPLVRPPSPLSDTSSHFSPPSSRESSPRELSPIQPLAERPKPQFSFSLALGSLKKNENSVAETLRGDRVDYVHGVRSTALPAIANQGLQPIAQQLEKFALSGQLPTGTEEQRKSVAEKFLPTMKTGERGNTLAAWEKNPQEPIATGISLFQAHNAQDATTYAKKGDGGFPVILGISGDVALQRKDVGHELTEGPVTPRKINAVYVPTGKSTETNAQLEETPLRGRAKSFPDLFNGGQ